MISCYYIREVRDNTPNTKGFDTNDKRKIYRA